MRISRKRASEPHQGSRGLGPLRLAWALVFAAGIGGACEDALPVSADEPVASELAFGVDPSVVERPSLAWSDDGEALDTVASAAPAPVERMAHDAVAWAARTEAVDVVDALPLGRDVLLATTHRDGWGLELWGPPAEGEVADSPIAALRYRSHHAAAPVLAGPPARSASPWQGLVLWLQDGALFAQSVDVQGEAITLGDARIAFMATETQELVGGPVAAFDTEHGSDGYLVCVQEDKRGLLCARVNRAGEAQRWDVVGALKGYEPRALHVVPEGFVGLASHCKREESCHQMHLATLHLGPDGRPARRRGTRGLAHVQGARPIVTALHRDGLIVAARRARGQHSTAWHVAHSAVKEQAGRFDRLAGGVYLVSKDGALHETWLLEESPLVMRGGFPVSLLRPFRWTPELGREQPLAWPAPVQGVQPGQPGQRVVGQHGLIVVLPPHRADGVDFTVTRLTPNAEEPSPPRPVHPPARKGRGKARSR